MTQLHVGYVIVLDTYSLHICQLLNSSNNFIYCDTSVMMAKTPPTLFCLVLHTNLLLQPGSEDMMLRGKQIKILLLISLEQ